MAIKYTHQDACQPLRERIAELEQELSEVKQVEKRYELHNVKLIKENASLKKRIAELEIHSELYATRYTAGFKAGMERAGYILDNHTFMVGTQELVMPQIHTVAKAIREEAKIVRD